MIRTPISVRGHSGGVTVTVLKHPDSVYTRRSVPFFQSYPGVYVPRPLEISSAEAEATPKQLANEMLALSKLNWNNTQFDGGEPITVRAARRVGDILKGVPAGGLVQPGFRFFM